MDSSFSFVNEVNEVSSTSSSSKHHHQDYMEHSAMKQEKNRDVEEQSIKNENFYNMNKPKRIICLTMFLASLTFISAVVNTLISFLSDLFDNEKIVNAMNDYIKTKKDQ